MSPRGEKDNLFEEGREAPQAKPPLAARMRPTSLDEIVGQESVIGEGTTLRALIERDELRSAILWGPAGTGKTTIAHIVADRTNAPVEKLSAISAGVADVRKVIADARKFGRTVLFLDEIHRFNRAQQDAFLGAVEEGLIVLIGATTENPFFEVNSPLLSRSLLFRLEPLSPENVTTLLRRALTDDRGLPGTEADDDALDWIADKSGGDGRIAYNALEAAAELSAARGSARINLDDVQQALARRAIRYDKAQDRHYDVISAFIKSMRGSDPDAALFWLFEMIEGGEDPRFIARRMIVLASEDIGLADPQALVLAVAAAQANEHVGLPESAFALAQAAVYLSLAPKSNAVMRAMVKARADVQERSQEVPAHLGDSDKAGQRKLRREGKGYKYPHNFPAGVEQEYRPPELEGKRYWDPDSTEPFDK
ncbi:MAG: replication-associated recombination protein A [Actinomycetota bacterium]